MNMPGSLFLTGPMGAGKSTIGRQLSKQLRRPFHDSDHEIENRTGVDIPLIFELEGEVGFRKRESAMIDELTQLPDIILATGGGAILDPLNRQHLRERGSVIYLHTSVDQQLKRTCRDRNRPLLQTDDPRGKLAALMSEREPLYREIADLVIDTDGKRVQDVVKQICKYLGAEHIIT
ncbi:MAG: shikimate kinase AroK [Gammaproteobacteria bacterium]|nr:shikimate kinase AroK [Gammaproteobacteria bacterium]NNJ95372.1 shikimate kinase AroK [Halobacteria archaeon]